MPFEIHFDKLPVGFVAAVTSERVLVRARGFSSSEDGDDFIRLLEGVSDMILSRAPRELQYRESMVDHLVAIVRKDKTALVYVNEIPLIMQCQVKQAVAKGQEVYFDQLADVNRLQLRGVAVPADAAVAVILSSRWRKGLYFDFEPVIPNGGAARSYDLEQTLGGAMAYLSFQNRININDQQWAEFLRQKWFPFICLGADLVREMTFRAKDGQSIDELIEKIEHEVKAIIPNLRAGFAKKVYFQDHLAVLEKGLDHFEHGDYLSCTGLLYPRIEGVIRSYHSAVAGDQKATQAALARSAVADPKHTRHEFSLLLPERFRHFLEQVYFASFDPSSVTHVSRNSVAHGVAPESAMSLKAALLGVLIIDQLSYMMNAS